MFKILVLEDDKELNRTVCAFLNTSGYEAVGCFNANEAYDALYENTIDLIVSDIMMPGVDGFEFARNIRDVNNDIPILFMTARDDIASKQRGFRIGVDDYMVKPIDLDELFLRIGALLRRAKIASSRKLEIGSFVMDADEHTAYLGDDEISLTSREFNILYKLLSYPKKTFTRTQLMDEFWDVDTGTAPRAVDVYMTKLRQKLSDCEDFEIKTVHNVAKDEYCFSKKYNLHIIDRVGGGDSFGGGLIYACMNGFDTQAAVEFAVAASALKHSIEGDYNMVTLAEVEKLAGGDGSGRIQR